MQNQASYSKEELEAIEERLGQTKVKLLPGQEKIVLALVAEAKKNAKPEAKEPKPEPTKAATKAFGK